jgi:hypothetical protein
MNLEAWAALDEDEPGELVDGFLRPTGYVLGRPMRLRMASCTSTGRVRR